MRWVVVLLGVFVGMPVAFLVALNLFTTDEKTDCATIRDPTPAQWQAADYDARSRIATDLSLCRRLQGRSQAEVEALLGPPTEMFAGGQSYRLSRTARDLRTSGSCTSTPTGGCATRGASPPGTPASLPVR